jgi:GT2 family glycosyltransferase
MFHELDLSIIVVHTYEKHLLRQTLKSIRQSAPQLSYEIVVVDNNPPLGMERVLKQEHPDARYIPLERNQGFGSAMNVGIQASRGKYVLIFNPDLVVQPGALEELKRFMDEHPDVGMVGPQLRNPDNSLQHSCYRFPSLMMPAYRRTPLGKTPWGKAAIRSYLMLDDAHDETMDVDSLIGAALFTRRQALNDVGLFDERFFMYYEDNDLCRRFWQHGHRVVYHPAACMMHYHRRASADGNLLRQLVSRFAWIQIASAIKFFWKYRGQKNPRLESLSVHVSNIA